jgi:hypothetical protein
MTASIACISLLQNSTDEGGPNHSEHGARHLALGALYEDNQDDSPIWMPWYFAEAQSMLGRVIEGSSRATLILRLLSSISL